MDKVKVSSEMAKAIEGALDEYNSDPNQVLENHRYDWVFECAPLNSLSHLQLAEIFLNGYEVEKTSQEKVKAYFDKCEQVLEEYKNGCLLMNADYKGRKEGVLATLSLLNIKVAGVND
ncbi:MAG TPA: hypothetical protein VNQ57_09690 [Ureibacillus sp.]|nr:hypothetical protein [Ureibacillus sp.]